MPILSIAPTNPSLAQGFAYAVMGFAIVFVMLFFLLVAIKIMVVIMRSFNKGNASEESSTTTATVSITAAQPAPAVAKVPAAGSLGEVAIHDVPEKTAAMIMAIVADKTGIPLNELRFKSIKRID